ncbi:dolichyl pyrophosphate Glc1Man9GlcNAc2 alpha-1,3-glucosyltransferase [Thalassiosira pseudonana CCMP1335]
MPPADVSAITHDGNAINKNSLLVGGLDVSFPKDDDNNQEAVAVYVILRYNNYPCTTITTTPQLVYRSHKFFKPTIPYIASYLAFREAIPLLQLISTQIQAQPEITPNVLFVDGNGQWHERRAGIACFVGVETGIPTVGVGKNFYSLDGVITSMDEMLTSLHLIANGLSLPMLDRNTADVLAYALVGHGGNVCNGVRGVRNPIYISAGSNITLEDAVVLSAHLSKSRVPEPVREADSYGRKLLREQRTTRA